MILLLWKIADYQRRHFKEVYLGPNCSVIIKHILQATNKAKKVMLHYTKQIHCYSSPVPFRSLSLLSIQPPGNIKQNGHLLYSGLIIFLTCL